MDLAQFEAIATLISSREPAKSAARRVLVDCIGNSEAAREFGLSKQSVSNTVGRFRAAESTILTAYRPLQESRCSTRSNVYNAGYGATHGVLLGAEKKNMLNSNVVQIELQGTDYPEVCDLLEKRSVLLKQLQRERGTSGAIHSNVAEMERIEARIVEIFGRTALSKLTPF
jgi:hypothetical protein